MKAIVVSDTFKGTFTSFEVNAALEQAIKERFIDAEVTNLTVADGGEGTVEALLQATGGSARNVKVKDPFLREIDAIIGIKDNTAYIEMAQASGLLRLANDELDPCRATTFGTGEMIKAALDEGVNEIIIGVGGSATNDVGIGMAQALGVEFYDALGNILPPRGDSVFKVDRYEDSNLDPRIKSVVIKVLCDVQNPLTGPQGATRIYGNQKGIVGELGGQFEEAHEKFNTIIFKREGIDLNLVPGSGAAGGLAGGLHVFLGASLQSGLDTVLEAVHFDKLVEDVDYVITGEGKLDEQSSYGKVPYGVAKAVKNYHNNNIHRKCPKVIAFVGHNSLPIEMETPFNVIFEASKGTVPYSKILDNKWMYLNSAIERLIDWMEIDQKRK
jgi:glycerate kinase